MPRNPFYRWPVATLILSLLACIPFIGQLREIRIGTDARTLLDGDQRNLASFEKITEILQDNLVLVVSLRTDRIFTREGLADIAALSEALLRSKDIIDVKSLTHSSKPVRQGFSFEMQPLVPGLPKPNDEQLARLRQFCLANPLIRNVIVAPDEQHTLITATYRRDVSTPQLRREFATEIDAILTPFRTAGRDIKAISLPMVEAEVHDNLQSDLRNFLPIAAGITLLLLILFLRSLAGVLLIFILQAAGLLLVPGIILATGHQMTVFNLLLLPLAAGVQLTLLTHSIGTIIRLRGNTEAADPVAAMLQSTLRPCLFATLTTIAGLLSLLLSDLPSVREIGLLGSLSITSVFLLTFGPGLALMRIVFSGRAGRTTRSSQTHPRPPAPQQALRYARWSAARKWPLAIGSVVILAVSLLAMARIRTDIRAVEFVEPSSPSRQAIEHFDSIYGGINVVQIDLDTGTRGGINAPAFLDYLQSLQRFAETEPAISGVYSYAQLLAMMNQIWEGEAEGSFRLPQSPLTRNLFVLALTSMDFPFLRGLCDPAMQTAHLVVRTPDMPTDDYLGVIHRILDHAATTAPDGVSVSAREGLHTIIEAERSILRSQLRTAGTTIIGIGIMLTLLWRSPRLALMALAVNMLPVLFVLGLAGIFNIPLNAISVMVAAIAFAIAVDDSVHFITSFLGHRSRGLAFAEAVAEALASKARPIILTSLILVGIFTTFLSFSFPPVLHFGLLCAAAFLAALLTTLLLLPALLQKSTPNGQEHSPQRGRAW